jgi:predicted metal-dependent phosphoesterase TrpH
MLKFTRNKVVSVFQKDRDTLMVHGLLEDDIYGLEVEVAWGLSDLEIVAIGGRWKRAENACCSRGIPFLQEAVGFRLDEGFRQNVQKIIGRKVCRHFADLLLECGDAARDAAMVVRGETERVLKPDPAFEKDRLKDRDKSAPPPDRQDLSADRPLKVEATDPAVAETMPSGKGTVIDLHVHTSPASPCSSVTVAELIHEAKKIGLNGICLTDHNHVWDAEEVADLRKKHRFLILRGNEITTDQGDMVVFGLEKEIKGIIKLEDLRREVAAAGGFLIVAHPFRGFLTFGVGRLGLTPEKAMERPLFSLVDAVEVMNSKVTEKENTFAARVAAGLGLPATGGSDAHEVSALGIYATRFAGAIKDEKDLVEALKGGQYTPVAFRRERSARHGSTPKTF